jgi:hypothetical protein
MACKAQTTAQAGKPAAGGAETMTAFIVSKDKGMTLTFSCAARDQRLHGEHQAPRP